MKFYGLHWKASDGTPLQIRIETRTMEMWARSCPRGGEWTAWRRLDVYRKADGTLDEVVAQATNAKNADTATRLATPVTINLNGEVVGSGIFDGANSIYISTRLGSASETGALQTQVDTLKQKLSEIEAGNTGAATDMKNRITKLEKDIAHLQALHNSGGDNNNN